MDSGFSTSQDTTSPFLPGRPPLSSQKLSYPRQRATRACRLCRARRTKCDNKKPACSFCGKIGAECVTGDGENAVLDAGSLKILQRIDNLETLVRSLRPPSPSTLNFPRANWGKYQLRVTTEGILSWAIFQGRYDSRRDLKTLLRADISSVGVMSPMSVDSIAAVGELEPTSCKRLLDNFFRFVHGKNPMLDEGHVRNSVNKMCLEGPAWDAESCLALVVCALGSIASPFDISAAPSSDPRATITAQSYFNASQKRLGTIIGFGGVLQARCFFYSGVYLMSKLQPVKAWRLFSQALACCQEFHCASPSYTGSLADGFSGRQGLPAEECVYWSCWKSERELPILLDLPDFSANGVSYPLHFPTPPTSCQVDHAQDWYFYLSEISLRRLEHRIRDEICDVVKMENPSSVRDLCRSAIAFEGLAEEWVRSLPPAMNLDTPQSEDDVLRFILRGHLLNLWEVMYWPFLEILMNWRVHKPEVVQYVRKGLQLGIDRIRINRPGFRHRHHGTWLMLQSCTRSALGLLAAAYCPEAAFLLPFDWKEAVFDTIGLLRFWQDEAPDATDRLKILEELISGIP